MFKKGDKVIVQSALAPVFNGSIGTVESYVRETDMTWVYFHAGHPDLVKQSCCMYGESLRSLMCLWET